MKKLLITLLLLLAPLRAYGTDSTASSYYVPPAQFNAQLQVMDMGFSNIFVLLQNATASFLFNEDAKSISRVRIALDVSTLMTNNNGNQRDLENLFDNGQYPEIAITSPDAVTFTDNKAQLKANITLHGQTKPVILDVVLNQVGKTPNSNSMWSKEGSAVGLSIRGSVKRADFGMGDDPKAGAPGRFGDTISFMMEMQALKQQ